MNNLLLGAAGLDLYPRRGVTIPGQGILHNAWHLQQLGADPLLITRLGDQDAELCLKFMRANQIHFLADTIVAPGQSAIIDVDFAPSGDAVFANWITGVWANFQLLPEEEELLAQAGHLHLVMIDEVIPEFVRISDVGLMQNVLVSADLFNFAFPLDKFARIAAHLDIGFIGWRGDLRDPTVTAIKEIATHQRVMIVFTLGDRGVQVFDAQTAQSPRESFFSVEPIAVTGNTNGCGDAFIAYFLAEYWRTGNLANAVEQGKIGGAAATSWQYGLPDEAYSI